MKVRIYNFQHCNMKKISINRLKDYPKADISLLEYRRLKRFPTIDWDDTPLEWNYAKSAKEFVEDDVTCFPVLDRSELVSTRERVTLAIIEAPEFIEKNSLIRQFDDSGLIGIASSFHHPELRALRRIVANRSSVFKRLVKKHLNYEYYHELLDQISFIRAGSIEYRRKVWSKNKPLGNRVMAYSVTNLNDHDISILIGKSTFLVPPGYRCVYSQSRCKMVKNGQFTLHQGIAWQDCPDPVFGKEYVDKVIEEQCSPLLPSGKQPLLYAKSLETKYPIDLELFARSMIGTMRSPKNFLYPVASMCSFSDMEKYCTYPKVKSKTHSLKSLGIAYKDWEEDDKTPFYCESR